jgi:hypothetical protein
MPILFHMMKSKQLITYQLLSAMTILTILAASIVIINHQILSQPARAQLSNNSIKGNASNQSAQSAVESFMSPKSLMQSIIEQTRNTNASGYAAKQLISSVPKAMNNTAAGMNAGMNNTAAGMNAGMNNTAAGMNAGMNNTAAGMKSVMQKLQNTNATSFASHNIINATKR